jgi:hypothetical protein
MTHEIPDGDRAELVLNGMRIYVRVHYGTLEVRSNDARFTLRFITERGTVKLDVLPRERRYGLG